MTHGGAIRYCTLPGTLPPQIRTAALFIPDIAANTGSRPRAAPLRCAGAHCTAAPIAFPRRLSRLSVPFPRVAVMVVRRSHPTGSATTYDGGPSPCLLYVHNAACAVCCLAQQLDHVQPRASLGVRPRLLHHKLLPVRCASPRRKRPACSMQCGSGSATRRARAGHSQGTRRVHIEYKSSTRNKAWSGRVADGAAAVAIAWGAACTLSTHGEIRVLTGYS